MLNEISDVKKKLTEAISQLCEVSWMFVKDPKRDFTKKRKLPFDKVISFLLAMEGGTLTTELLKYFGRSPNIASTSAFVQQRGKIGVSAFSSLFDVFVQKTHKDQCYKGLHPLAADGSDLQVPTNSNDPDSYFPAKEGQSAYNLLHLDAMYDLLRHTYTDAVLLGQRRANERSSLCDMVDRSSLEYISIGVLDGIKSSAYFLAFADSAFFAPAFKVLFTHKKPSFHPVFAFPKTSPKMKNKFPKTKTTSQKQIFGDYHFKDKSGNSIDFTAFFECFPNPSHFPKNIDFQYYYVSGRATA